MTLAPVINAVVAPAPNVDSIWIASRPTNINFNEGTVADFKIQCLNAIPGVSKFYWKLAGGKAAPAAWAKTWEEAWNEVMIPRGMRFTALSANFLGATTGGLVEVLPGYDGYPIVMYNQCLANKRTDVLNGSPGQVQVTLQMALPVGTTGILFGNGGPFFISDTSKTPTGTPTFRPELLYMDGTPAGASFSEGGQFKIRLNTENMKPGTNFLFAAVNQGQGKIVNGMQKTIKDACDAVPGVKCQTEYAIRGNYNGGVVTYLDNYRDDTPIEIPIQFTEDQKTTGDLQLDFQTHRWVDGDPDQPAVRYGGTLTVFVRDTSVEPTPSYWRINAKRSGSNLVYTLSSPSGTSDGSVVMSHTGTIPPGFAQAMQAAAASTPGITLSGSTIYSTGEWKGVFTWSVPNPGGAGKHGLTLSQPTAPTLTIVGDACVFFQPVTAAAFRAPTYVTGVNISGGDFGNTETNIYGTNYRYPARPENPDPALRYTSPDYHFAKGSRICRLPIRWERIQRDGFYTPLSGEKPADVAWDGRIAYDIARIDDLIAYNTSLGVITLLDLHNYIGFSGKGKVGPNLDIEVDALVDVWVRLAQRYENNPMVWFDIMNEPNGGVISAQLCRDLMDWVVNAIRARTNSINLVMLAGTHWTGAGSWLSEGNAQAFQGYSDPADNFLVGMHLYQDSDSSGTKGGGCDVNSWNRIVNATNWLIQNNMRGFIGELGISDPARFSQCGIENPKLMAYIESHQSAWAGFTAWGGGPTYNETYVYRLDPITGQDTPQMTVLAPFLKKIA